MLWNAAQSRVTDTIHIGHAFDKKFGPLLFQFMVIGNLLGGLLLLGIAAFVAVGAS